MGQGHGFFFSLDVKNFYDMKNKNKKSEKRGDKYEKMLFNFPGENFEKIFREKRQGNIFWEKVGAKYSGDFEMNS